MLHLLRSSLEYEPVALLTTVNAESGCAAMHGTPRELLAAQARETELPLWEAPIPSPCPNGQYEAAMRQVCEQARREGIGAIAFGDLFLEEIRRYREDRLAQTGLTPVFPLWDLETGSLARKMIAAGLRARVVSVDLSKLPASYAGRDFDLPFLAELPAGTDPCGENGEFHTFAYAGPMFRRAIPVASGPIVESGGFATAAVLAGR